MVEREVTERHVRILARLAEVEISMLEALGSRLREASSGKEVRVLAAAGERLTGSLRETMALESELRRELRVAAFRRRRLERRMAPEPPAGAKDLH
jgi:hypothetical protein